MSGTIYSGVTATATRRAGVVTLEINGEAVDVASDLVYDATYFKREMLVGQSGVQGYSETPKTGVISCTLRDAATLSQSNVMNMTNVPIVAVLANGKSVYGDSMTCTECGEVRTAEGTFEVRFEGFVTESST